MRLAFALIALPLAAQGAESLCTPQETVVFACPVGKKLVSACASKGLSARAGTLQYRFGLPGAVELTLPAAAESPTKNVRAQTLMFSGGGGAALRFLNGRHSYVLYTAIGKGWGEKSGVAVMKDGKLSAALRCREAPVSELGPDFFTQAGIPQDEEDFDLP